MAGEPAETVPEASQAAAAEIRRNHLLRIAQDPDTDPEVLQLVVQQAGTDDEILRALAGNPNARDQTLVHVAFVGPQAAIMELAARPARIRAHPAIGQAILKDPRLDEVVRAAVTNILREAGAAPEAPPGAFIPFGRDNLLAIARSPQADPAALNIVARETGVDDEIFLALVRNPRTPDRTLTYVGLVGGPAVLKEMAAQAARLRDNPEIAQAILENPDAGDDLRGKVRAALGGIDAPAAKRSLPVYQLIKGLSTGQRLALAIKGTKEARMILVKDPNEMVALEVVYSPRITETEVLAIAQMRDVHENVLRAIAGSKLYRGNKSIAWALLNNPKTPPGLAMGLGLGGLSEKELDQLVKNRNISAILQRAARSALEKKRKRAGGVRPGH